jgi:putative glycerol-1-phosphate prenyltransferase
MQSKFYNNILQAVHKKYPLFAVLIDPEDFNCNQTIAFLDTLPNDVTHIFVGGSTDIHNKTETVVTAIKKHAHLPVFLFPGDYLQITAKADALLFLSLLSGRNAEYLIGQQVKAIPLLKETSLEIISTGYILIAGGTESSVARVSKTQPISQNDVQQIVNTAIAGQYLGAKLIYLEAGSGAKIPVSTEIISAVKNNISIPLLVGGGIKTMQQKQKAFQAGADMVIMGTVFENK